jgi:uracil phosphoribosyltransferase
MVVQLNSGRSIANRFLAELRDEHIQKDPLRFRRNLERVGELLAYELSRTLEYTEQEVMSPLGLARMELPADQPVLATILRAGLPLHQGLLNYFDRADSAFVSAYRKHRTGEDGFDIEVEYMSSPRIDDRVLVISDPMLATGRSMVLVYKALLRMGRPKALHIVSVIASAEGLEYVQKHLPANARIWVGAVDEEMNDRTSLHRTWSRRRR